MTRSSLVRLVAQAHQLPRETASEVVTVILEGLNEGLCAGKRVEIRGLGSIRPRHYAAYEGRNPRTGERVVVSRKVLPVFRPGKSLLQRLDLSTSRED